jgi:hypothetical protein
MRRLAKYALLTSSALLLISGPSLFKAFGCATDLKSAPNRPHQSAWEKYWKAHHLGMKKNNQTTRTPSAVDTTSWSQDRPWGGKDSSLWKSEAIVANAASDALLRGFAQTNAQEVLVSIPVKMLYGNVRPYGDGQTNALVTLGSYRGTYPPLVASWISFSDGTKMLNIRFVRTGGLKSDDPVTLDFANGSKPVNLGTVQSVQDGLFEINWKATQVQWGDLYQNRVA